MNEIVREFLLETQENLAQLDLDLVTLEKEPTERETLARAFRTLHTVKGTAGFMGLMKLQGVAHAAENLLSRLRAGELRFNPPIASALLATVDAIRQMLDVVERTEQDGDADFREVIQTLDRLRLGEAPLVVMEPTVPDSVVLEAPDAKTAVADTAIRVDVGLLDDLMNLVGELVLARNQIVQYSGSQENTGYLNTVQKLNLITTELQAGVMKTRLQPIGNLWSKLPRLVRDIALSCGKQVRLEMEGRETELDKTIIEAVRDPLTHLVRNCIDHGIETPPARETRGKAAEGVLKLHAFHEGGKVIIEISDDGAGIDPHRIRDKALRLNLLTATQADRLSDREMIDLIFQPGFTTAENVTNFSGRGVGMDVVRTNIERIGGSIEVDTRLGLGTTLRMKIPLTLAIIPAVTVTSGGDRYAIPQINLLEMVRLEGEQARIGIENMHGAPVYRLRGKLLPIVYLAKQLGTDREGEAPAEPRTRGILDAQTARQEPRPPVFHEDEINIVVLQAEDRSFGLVVDAIHDTEEIVVKPMQKLLKGFGCYAGATIMGDGKVALILDVLAIAQQSNVVSGVRTRAVTPMAEQLDADRQSLLLFNATDGGRMAIPLAQVSRLEEFPRSAVERVGSQDVIQYRKDVMPLLDVARMLKRRRGRLASPRGDDETIQVIVYAGKKQSVGLVVGEILDAVEEAISVRSPAYRAGVLFTAIIQDRTTEFLDIDWLIRAADPDFVEQSGAIAVEAGV